MAQESKHHNPQAGHPQKPAERHHDGAVELAAINETLKSLSKKYDENNKKNPTRDKIKFIWQHVDYLLRQGLRFGEFHRAFSNSIPAMIDGYADHPASRE